MKKHIFRTPVDFLFPVLYDQRWTGSAVPLKAISGNWPYINQGNIGQGEVDVLGRFCNLLLMRVVVVKTSLRYAFFSMKKKRMSIIKVLLEFSSCHLTTINYS